ncbi:PAS domain-containing protein [Pseudalkalibacillus caeni]|uniref:histidine kinase n=1 Tax=Exobacillus caeni TaxID=2574798 RepID=A0A5R9FEH1_9BACL|nr:PAS domain-containing protein [Pseudalkalibacillus caeni]TLS38964.1 PAS domain S-box protein [Pseudalkalibacillus caeni]
MGKTNRVDSLAEKALFESNKRLEKSEKMAHIGHWEWNLQTDKISLSKEMLRILGLNGLSSITLEERLLLVHPEDLHYYADSITNSKELNLPYDIEYRIIQPSGEERVVREQADVKEKHGETYIVYGTALDITESKQSEKALWKSQYNLAKAQRIARLVNWEYDLITGELTWSNGVYEIFGMVPEKIEDFARLIHPNDIDFVVKTGNEAKQGKPYNIEYRVICPDGVEKVIYEQAEVIYNRNGRAERMLGTVQDITERKKTEEHLLNSEKLSLVGQLAAGVAHEVRNPLTSIRGFLQLLQSGVESNPKYYEIMLKELDRIEFIVGEFLSLAKPQTPTIKEEDLINLIKQVMALLSTQSSLHNVQFVEKFELESITVSCDANQIKQVLINVLKNAIDAMPGGGTITITAGQQADGKVLLRFADQGCGIKKERLKKIGQPFYSTKEKGTGLGLMICQKIIEGHHGDLRIDSTYGKGTVVTVILPVSYKQSPVH